MTPYIAADDARTVTAEAAHLLANGDMFATFTMQSCINKTKVIVEKKTEDGARFRVTIERTHY